MSDEVDVSLLVLYSIFAGLVVISNSIVVVVVVKSRELHLPTLWNIAFMAAWDLALGLYFLVFVVPSKAANTFAYSEKLMVPASILLSLLIAQCILNIVLALVDRYISISWPLQYPRLMSSRRFALAAVIIFSINLTRVSLLALVNLKVLYSPRLGVCISTNDHDKLSSVALILVSFILVVCLLVTVLVKLWKVRRGPTSKNGTSTQFTFTVCLSTIVFIASFLPVGVAAASAATFKTDIPDFQVKFAMTCILSNSLWNVYVYKLTYKPFKDAFLKVFCPSIYRLRAQRKVHSEFELNRNQIFRVCDTGQ